MSREVDDRAFVWLFARRYRQMLIGRVARINTALQQLDIESALDAALSLKVSSATVGTCELADLAQQVEADVRRRDVTAARLSASRLWPAAVRADRALGDYLAG
jgi:HPt (histidine-containing phosphotransfer) domain-containing protein